MPKPKVVHDLFTAISDPTRRRILEFLTAGPQPVTSIVERFSISQPSISEHLRLLREAGVVQMTPSGRLRIYSVNAGTVRQLADWAARLTSSVPADAASDQLHRHMTMDID
ncbi:MAG: winged helix-turn-helix transcriptional regulator [Planctomycetes bacterium]|nr:winged helix-turn-helix transcriptional regulator [Planctomycetota bacterium]